MLGLPLTGADTTSFLLHPVEQKIDAEDRNETRTCGRHSRLKRHLTPGRNLRLNDENVPGEAERFLRRATHGTLEFVLHALDVARRVERLSAATDSCCTAAERRETNRTFGFRHETTYF
jgi:hypothetical protein